MISNKRFMKSKGQYQVTFQLPESVEAESASLVGEFNNWDPNAEKLKRSQGVLKTTVYLDPGTEFQYLFVVNGEQWIKDDEAEKFVPNEHGGENSVVVLEAR